MKQFRYIGHTGLVWLQDLGLMLIAICTVIAMGAEIKSMIDAAHVSLADLLLMFIFLEVLAMVSIYLESGKLPVRMPLYIAMVALARYLIIDMKGLDTTQMLAVAVSTLILGMSVLIIRFSHAKFPDTDDS